MSTSHNFDVPAATTLSDDDRFLHANVANLLRTAYATGGQLREFIGRQGNFLTNPEFSVNFIDSPPFTSAKTYTAPLNKSMQFCNWWLYSDGDNVVSIDGSATYGRTIRAQAVLDFKVLVPDKKFGLFQPIHWLDARRLHNTTVSLSFAARTGTGAAITRMKAAIVKTTTSSKDVFSRQFIASWNGYGTNPTLHAHWEYVAVKEFTLTASVSGSSDDDHPDTNAYWPDRLALENVFISAEPEGGNDANNIGVFLWVDEDCQVNDRLHLTQVDLRLGARATDFMPRAYQEEIDLCDFYRRVYNIGMSGVATSPQRISVGVPSGRKMNDNPDLSLIATSIIFSGQAGNATMSDNISLVAGPTKDSNGGARVSLQNGTTNVFTSGAVYTSNQQTLWLLSDARLGDPLT